jgi:predicted GIY-YIG superfamily endonuclease
VEEGRTLLNWSLTVGTYKVYVIECTSRGSGRVTIHVGIAKDVSKRISDHRCGKVRATRGRNIRWLGNSEKMPHGDALRLEIELKKLTPKQKGWWAQAQEECCWDLNQTPLASSLHGAAVGDELVITAYEALGAPQRSWMKDGPINYILTTEPTRTLGFSVTAEVAPGPSAPDKAVPGTVLLRELGEFANTPLQALLQLYHHDGLGHSSGHPILFSRKESHE